MQLNPRKPVDRVIPVREDVDKTQARVVHFL